MADLDRRDHFLIAMYNQLMNDINRHIVVVWQSVATLFAAFAGFSLVKDNVITLDIATAVVLAACVWLLAHVYDASYWYNRNLVMIANIERQFLVRSDLKDIHYYFGKHRPLNSMISHLRIQRLLGLIVAALVLAFHFNSVLRPIFSRGDSPSIVNWLPWITAGVGIVVWKLSADSNKDRYAEFLRNSPGIDINTTGITYGPGHGHGDEQA